MPIKYDPYVLYVTRHQDETGTQVMVVTYPKAYQARKFLDLLLKDDGWVWDDCHPSADPGSTIRSETGIVVSTRFHPERMRKAVEHEYEIKEMVWDLPPEHRRWALRFRNGPELPKTLEEAGITVDAEGRRERKQRKSSAPRADAPAGYVHVSDVALSMGIDAKQARVALRKLYPDGKPAYGWYFDPKALDDLKARIKEQLK